MAFIRNQIPNAVTCLNLFFGLLAILHADTTFASWCIVLAAVADFFDGFTARLLKSNTVIGKELDSLADMVSFGVAPSLILYHLAEKHNTIAGLPVWLLPGLCLLVAIFSAVRLAKFNIDTRQSDRFIGVPTPANALLIASFPFIVDNSGSLLNGLLASPWFYMLFPILSSYLLIAELPLLALKFKHYSWQGNGLRYTLVIGAVAMAALLGFSGVPFIFLLYISLSLIDNFQS